MKAQSYRLACLSIVTYLAALCLVSCLLDIDEEEEGGLTTATLKGTWTTIEVSNVPSSMDEDALMSFDFHIYLDDGYQYESGSQVGQVELEGDELKQYGTTVMTIHSFKNKKLKVSIPRYGSAIFTMKKMGTLNDDDYRAKLCHGVWIHSLDDSNPNMMSYEALRDVESAQQMARMYGDRFFIIRFYSDGTGECRRDRTPGYTFTWTLSDKTLTLNTSQGAQKTAMLSFVGIEGDVELQFNRTFNWY